MILVHPAPACAIVTWSDCWLCWPCSPRPPSRHPRPAEAPGQSARSEQSCRRASSYLVTSKCKSQLRTEIVGRTDLTLGQPPILQLENHVVRKMAVDAQRGSIKPCQRPENRISAGNVLIVVSEIRASLAKGPRDLRISGGIIEGLILVLKRVAQ